MTTTYGHATVDVQKAAEHLRKDPGLPFEQPMPSLWQDPPTSGVFDRQSPVFPSSTDVVIIGSGIAGASIAKHLLEGDKSIKVVTLEARTLTSGATGRNGGHIMVIPELFYAGFKAAHGEEVAQKVTQFTFANQDALLDMIETLPTALRDRSELRRLEVLHVFRSEKTKANAENLVNMLQAELPHLNRRSKILSRKELSERYGIDHALGGVTLPAGAASPYRLITGILAGLQHHHADRFSIETNTPAESIEWNVDGTERYRITTPRGTIMAKQVIHATNTWAGHLLPSLRGFVYPLKCQVTVQEQHPHSTNQGSKNTWCITSPGALNSVYQSPQTGDLYVSGLVGVSDFFDEVTSHEDKNDKGLVDAMATVMNETYGKPVQGAIKANWTGIMGYTADGAPLIGRLSEELSGRGGNGEWIAAGFNGVGMVNAWLCGEHVADGVLGRTDPREIPSVYVASKERIANARVEHILHRSYAVWE